MQELLLEDGELHGSGRERQFRWKNIDNIAEGEEQQRNEDDVYLDEEESEEQWRKKRYEREMFLKEKQKRLDEENDLLGNSQILKLGQKVLQRSTSTSSSLPSTPTEGSGGDGVLKTVKSSILFQVSFYQ